MTNRAFRFSQLVLALGLAGLFSAGLPIVADRLAPESGFVSEVHAQDTHSHDEGGTTSHGHAEGSSGGPPPWAGTPGGRSAYLGGGTTGGHDSGGTTGGHDSGGSSGHSGGGGPPPGKGPGGSGGGHDTGGTTGGHDTGGTTGGHDSGGTTGGHDSGGTTGGHDSGGTTGGHDSGGGSSHAGGGCGGGSGGHSGGGGCGGGGGEEGMGKGYMYGKETHGGGKKHVGHMSGQHGSPHETGADRHFGGGSGLGGIGGVPEGPGNGRGAGRRYWGGWVIPDGEEPTAVAVEESLILPGPGGGGYSRAASLSGSFRCSDVGPVLAQKARFSDKNMERGHEVQKALQSDATSPDAEYQEHSLLANFQEEMLKPKPDPTVAGTYLGLIARTEVTPELVEDVCFHMCVPAGDTVTLEAIASNAEVVRVAVQ